MPPLLGRWFGDQDVQSGAPLVVLINYNFWKREFHGDKNVLGQSIMLNGKSRTIIGVTAPRFQAVGADVYLPVSWTRPEPTQDRFDWDVDDPLWFWATGILKRNVSFQTAEADIDVIARQLAPKYPDLYPKKFRVSMKFLNDVVLGSSKQTLLLLFAAVGLLLFISCRNVAGLLLAQASARTKEISLRAALGAGQLRLIRQLLSESLVLAGAGCALGCTLAYAGLKALLATHLAPLPGGAARRCACLSRPGIQKRWKIGPPDNSIERCTSRPSSTNVCQFCEAMRLGARLCKGAAQAGLEVIQSSWGRIEEAVSLSYHRDLLGFPELIA